VVGQFRSNEMRRGKSYSRYLIILEDKVGGNEVMRDKTKATLKFILNKLGNGGFF
jgi:hypothetical protein